MTLDEAKRSRGERVEDGTAQRDKPLFQILQENKDKKDAEFNERFKHRPPKALDEDETEFLDKLALSRREYDQQVANEEAEQLRSFHEAVAAQSTIAHELGEMPTVSMPEESKPKPPPKRSQPEFLRNITVSVKPRAKKAKSDLELYERFVENDEFYLTKGSNTVIASETIFLVQLWYYAITVSIHLSKATAIHLIIAQKSDWKDRRCSNSE
ncbi:hypothetical protein TRIUR3_10780 [Triticum urartu]|uniref:FAM192A/Fyv6 N-terminal domain-containing protein n=1 Tax=Triticum urartu TaxID=4572 RepID=M8B4T9_TRIUA|nr:hypothetical protein TRIUR3_10780 [Triticum urartu]